ncbi:hypothetical protein G4D82_12425 [Flavobacterium sp. CYK-4]|uniref:endonuclease/exonuclease/phosphatase family protein n=1 Tax=Flavobacterium lotistagni TaxID=2709660 RepID=UPI00140BE42D|nr:endonuclease/exonuclease/phosphatase family protein [Flavobacterium lotistagni]NHM08029.1 hypothetical protein [Flavobacterium lotistagni]
MKIKVTNFNVENLFNRYSFLDQAWENKDYNKFIQVIDVVSLAGRDGSLVSYQTTNIQRNNTAMAILETEPDFLAVQEVENIETLRVFNNKYLDDYFEHIFLLEGNDPRGIDVGFMIKKGLPCKVLNIRTNCDLGVTSRVSIPNMGYMSKGALFSRDCLEVDVEINNKVITFLVNHFKAQDGKESSINKRITQAKKVLEIAKKAFDQGKLPIVLGDLNMDINKPEKPSDNSVNLLIDDGLLKDHFPKETWTHYYTSGKEVSRLDYILPHASIEVIETEIFRKGITTKCKQYQGDRFATIGPEHTEASDHCPTSIIIEI